MDWSITGGDILQLGGFLIAAAVFVMKLNTQISVMRAEMKALERRVDGLEQGIREDIREIKNTLQAVFDRLDRKADK